MKALLKQPFQLIIICIIIAGIFLRLVNLEQKVYWKDEVFTSLRISGYTEQEVVENIYDGRVISLEDLQKYQQTRLFSNPLGTIYGLAKEEAQLPPLYFLIVKLWVSIFGNSIAITRSISVIFSILSFLILYLLCRELFELKMVAWVGMALIAVSPFQIIYSQTARPYSLWLLTSLLSGLMLLRALRIDNNLSWKFYTLTIVLGLYTSPFSLFCNLGQGIYVLSLERFKINTVVKKYLTSLVLGILGFSPWLLIIALRYHQIKGRTNWSSYSYANGVVELVFNWLRNITRLFIDFEQLNSSFLYIYQNPFLYLITVIPIMILVIYSLYYLCKNTQKSTWLFIILWISSTALPLIFTDLYLGGKRSGTARYLLPSYLGIQVAVGYFLATKVTDYSSKFNQQLWKKLTIFLCSISLLSSIHISPQLFWWNNDPSRYLQNSEIVKILNNSPNSLVISDAIWDEIITLSYSISDNIKYQLVKQYNDRKIPDNFSHYFLYKPSKSLQSQFKENNEYQIQPAVQGDKSWLWIIKRTEVN